jgi:hypothetical protein
VIRRVCPCGAVFYARHGNQRYHSLGCPARKKRRPAGLPRVVRFEPRECDFCGRLFLPKVSHQRFCTYGHQLAGRQPEERRLYHNAAHRRARQILAGVVAAGEAVCLGPNGCQQPILPGERWDVGHLPDGSRIPQHARCNRRTAGKRSAPASAEGSIW